MPYPLLNLAGSRFGLLHVIRRAPSQGRRTAWHCECDCGRQVAVRTVMLRRKVRPVKSCGCLEVIRTKESNTTHGHAAGKTSPTYVTWKSMRDRCLNPESKDYQWYGARGVSICPRWSKFEQFLMDMGDRPRGTTIDRFPNRNGNYEPMNCRWATPKEQANNRNPPRRRVNNSHV